jgi:hypothetical protein
MSVDGSISEAPEESDTSAVVIGPRRTPNEQLSPLGTANGILFRSAAASEVRTKRELVNDQEQRNMRHSIKLKKHETLLRRRYRENERMRSDLMNREKNV